MYVFTCHHRSRAYRLRLKETASFWRVNHEQLTSTALGQRQRGCLPQSPPTQACLITASFARVEQAQSPRAPTAAPALCPHGLQEPMSPGNLVLQLAPPLDRPPLHRKVDRTHHLLARPRVMFRPPAVPKNCRARRRHKPSTVWRRVAARILKGTQHSLATSWTHVWHAASCGA